MTDSRSHASQGNDRVLLGYDAIEESDLVGMAMDVKEAFLKVINVTGADTFHVNRERPTVGMRKLLRLINDQLVGRTFADNHLRTRRLR